MLPRVSTTLPPELKITPLADQSIFVRGAVSGVIREAVIAACLTALMILLFLGSWRSTLIIAVSIPLSILTSIIVLSALGETINIMTLGGLALAVGILVDDATVTIENIERYLEEGKEITRRSSTARRRSRCPRWSRRLCICIVFLPMFFLGGRGALPVRAAGRGGGLRHARVLRAVAHAGADAGDVSAAGEAHHAPRVAQSAGAFSSALRARLRAAAPGYPGAAADAWCLSRRGVHAGVSAAVLRARSSWCPGSARTSSRIPTAASSSCTCAPRPARASRRPRGSAIWWRNSSAARSRPREMDNDPRQHRLPYSTDQH
jgi:hypothetical protein